MILERFTRTGREDALRGGGDRAALLSAAETVLLTAATLALCLWLRPADPFFLSAQFPWTWMVPILVALRYGSAAALLSSLVLVAGWGLVGAQDAGRLPEIPKGYFLGGVVASLVCGEFRDLWRAETRRERKSREHLEHRLEELSGAYQALAQSHERLMTDFITHPPTLRDALAELPRPRDGRLDSGSAQALLIFLARYFQLETAAFHAMEDRGLRAAPLAALGRARSLDGRETLVAACLRSGSLCHALMDGEQPGPYLFVAPLQGAAGGPLAVLAVEKMPFFAFQEENLRGLFAVLGYYADLLQAAALAAPVLARLPDCPEEFAAGYLRLHRLRVTAGVPSVLAARLHRGPADGGDWQARAAAAGRGADLFWHRELPDGTGLLLALLPFCGEEQGRAFLARLEDGPGTAQRVKALTDGDAVRDLEDFLAGMEGRVVVPSSAPPAGTLRAPSLPEPGT